MCDVVRWSSGMGECFFAEKRWVNPKNINEPKSFEKGDFPRVYCLHESAWCACVTNDPEDCCIYTKHRDE